MKGRAKHRDTGNDKQLQTRERDQQRKSVREMKKKKTDKNKTEERGKYYIVLENEQFTWHVL